jgi:molybdopterin synthase sulfur carrier subunit
MIRVALPPILQRLAGVGHEVVVEVEGPATQGALLDQVEARFPMLRGLIRDHQTRQRRPYLRFFACQEDVSHLPAASPLPEAVIKGEEPFMIIGAISGG